jgi:hypothetical protein
MNKLVYQPAILKGAWTLRKNVKIRVSLNQAAPIKTTVGMYFTKSAYSSHSLYAVRQAIHALANMIAHGDPVLGLTGNWFGIPVQIDLVKEGQ